MTAAKSKNERKSGFDALYRNALRDYVANRTGSALAKAGEFGHCASRDGRGFVNVALLHCDTLNRLTNGAKASERSALLKSGAKFLEDALAAHEESQAKHRDAVRALRHANLELENRARRIARALHDEPSQLIVVAYLALAKMSKGLREPQRRELKRVESVLNEVQEHLRRYSRELRPPMLDDLGWIPAIRFLAEGIMKSARVPIEISAGDVRRLPDAVENVLYRVVEEALANVTKHAKAKRVSICVHHGVGELNCWIRDDGSGFDIHAYRLNTKRAGLGIIVMQERLDAIGGALSIESALGAGTELLIRVPS